MTQAPMRRKQPQQAGQHDTQGVHCKHYVEFGPAWEQLTV